MFIVSNRGSPTIFENDPDRNEIYDSEYYTINLNKSEFTSSQNISGVVFGKKCIDKFTYGKAFRLCPDYPAPVFTPGREVIDDGMAGNVVNNLKSLGIEPDFYHNREELIKQRFVDELTNHTFLRVDNTDKVANLKGCRI